ncbi:hypothetical protein [Pontimicrobium sp. MEBiC01747]
MNLKEPNKIRVNENDLDNLSHSEGGYMRKSYKGKPFAGYMVMDYHENGNVMFEEEYRDGEHQGWDNEYYETGIIKDSSLMIGATCLKYIEYDTLGNVISDNKQVSQDEYSRLVRKYNLVN